MPIFRPGVAAVQATPVILDADATVDKAAGLLAEASQDGVELAVFPEAFVSIYPSGAWGHQAARFDGFDETWERLWASSVEVPGPRSSWLRAGSSISTASSASTNREVERPGTLYNSVVLLGPEGCCGNTGS